MKDAFDKRVCIACTGIMWDADGETPCEIGLPENVVIINPNDEMINDCDYYNDEVVNYLSDKYGFCIEGFSMHLCTLISAEDE